MPASIPAPSGSPVQNVVLTAANGTWGGTAPFGFAYQWKRCTSSSGVDAAGATCSSIAGATSRTHQVGVADSGKHLRVGVRATDLVLPGLSAERLSASVGPVAAPVGFKPTPPSTFPKLLNKASAPWGQTLTIDTGGDWKSNGTTTATSFAYRWYRYDANGAACALLPDTGVSYVTTTADVDHGQGHRHRHHHHGRRYDQLTREARGPVRSGLRADPVGARRASRRGSGVRRHQAAVDRGGLDRQQPDLHPALAAVQRDGPAVRDDQPTRHHRDYPVTSADLGYTFRVEVTATVVDSFQSRHSAVQSARTAVVKTAPLSAAQCATLRAKVATAKKAVAAATKALKQAKQTGNAFKIRKAKMRLAAAKKTLAKARAAVVAGSC